MCCEPPEIQHCCIIIPITILSTVPNPYYICTCYTMCHVLDLSNHNEKLLCVNVNIIFFPYVYMDFNVVQIATVNQLLKRWAVSYVILTNLGSVCAESLEDWHLAMSET